MKLKKSDLNYCYAIRSCRRVFRNCFSTYILFKHLSTLKYLDWKKYIYFIAYNLQKKAFPLSIIKKNCKDWYTTDGLMPGLLVAQFSKALHLVVKLVSRPCFRPASPVHLMQVSCPLAWWLLLLLVACLARRLVRTQWLNHWTDLTNELLL